MSESISRRGFLKAGGMAAALAAGASVAGLAAPVQQAQARTVATGDEKSTESGHYREGLPDFLQKPATPTDIKETYDYDVVVLGAGSPGVPCALKAREMGASVALVQKENKANAHGNTGSAPDLEKSDPASVQALISLLIQESGYRPNRALYEMWAERGAEALRWVIEKAQEGGAQVIDQGNPQHMATNTKYGFDITYVTSYFGPKPYCVGDGMQALASVAANEGVDIYYNTQGLQLVQDESGKVTGVICLAKDKGYVQFNAKNGVVVATGDYQNDEDMLRYYLPDMTNFTPKQIGRTGDGHKMVVWAGGAIEPLGHTHMLHDFDAAPASMCNMPFLRMKMDGTRFCNETCDMSVMNNFLRSAEDQGNYVYVFDSDYMTKAADFPGSLVDPEALRQYMPEEDVEHTGVLPDQINTWKADTLEELAAKLRVTDTSTFVNTVKRWNKMCKAGTDTEFGLDKQYLKTIDKAPFYGAHLKVRMSSICCGVLVNDELQCTRPDGTPIENLYAAGNVAGCFYGGIDYPLTVPGVNLGHNYTQGYVLGERLGSM